MEDSSVIIEGQHDIRTVQLCVFRIAKIEYAIDILQVQEIIKPLEITPVPTTPAYIPGVINLRGAIISVLKIEDFLEIEDTDFKVRQMLIIRDGRFVISVGVEKVVDIINAPEKDIMIYGENDPTRADKYILGKCTAYGENLLLMDIHRLINIAKANI